MNRFVWSNGEIENGEEKIHCRISTRLYDGDTKTSYENGTTTLTTYRIIWQDANNASVKISLRLELIKNVEKHAGGIARSAKISLCLLPAPANKKPGPFARSKYNVVKIAFKSGGENQFHTHLLKALQDKKWIEEKPITLKKQSEKLEPIVRVKAAGIGGIQRSIEQTNQENTRNISLAFQDLSKLMTKAKEMVELSSMVAAKIKEKKGDITDDETVKFKSYLLSLGIANPVTKETHGTGTHYHQQLAHEICRLLAEEVDKESGIMLLSDAYCRINRARGLELLSPDDLLNACKMLANLPLPLKLRQFDSGVLVLQSNLHDDDVVITQTSQLVEESTSLSAQELANMLDISVLLAKERLLLAEKVAGVCRDDSSSGLRFYPNLFLTKA